MVPLALCPRAGDPLAILCLGAHADDIEIGAGGAVLTLLERYPGSRVLWVVFSATPRRTEEARCSAAVFLEGAGSAEVAVHDFQDGFFPSEFRPMKQVFEGMKAFSPDLVLTHHKADYHQDHGVIAELTWNTFRDHLILEYEVPKYDPDLANPNVFIPLTHQIADAKISALLAHFPSQRSRRWFARETFLAMMRIRGVQAAASSGLAEGFYAPKLHLLP